MFFFFNDTATTEIYTLSLHDALPIYVATELLRSAGGGIERGDEPAPQHDEERVREADQFVEVGGDQQDSQPFGACVLEQLPDCGLSTDVDAPRGMGRDEQPRTGAHLAAHDELLLVAAG